MSSRLCSEVSVNSQRGMRRVGDEEVREGYGGKGRICSWKPAAERRVRCVPGVVRGYRIHYAAVSDIDAGHTHHQQQQQQPAAQGDEDEDEDEDAGGVWRVHEVTNSSHSEAVISGLHADTWYQLDISAFTRRTDGLRTRPRRVKTHGAGMIHGAEYSSVNYVGAYEHRSWRRGMSDVSKYYKQSLTTTTS